MFKDATGGHASVDVQCDHDVIVHSWGRWDVGAWCSVHVYHDLSLLTALSACLSSPHTPILRWPRWRLRSCSSVSTVHLLAYSGAQLPRLIVFVFSGRAILTQITKTRTWGTGIPTRSWNRQVSTPALPSNTDPEKMMLIWVYLCPRWMSGRHAEDQPLHVVVHSAILSTFLCLGVMKLTLSVVVPSFFSRCNRDHRNVVA